MLVLACWCSTWITRTLLDLLTHVSECTPKFLVHEVQENSEGPQLPFNYREHHQASLQPPIVGGDSSQSVCRLKSNQMIVFFVPVISGNEVTSTFNSFSHGHLGSNCTNSLFHFLSQWRLKSVRSTDSSGVVLLVGRSASYLRADEGFVYFFRKITYCWVAEVETSWTSCLPLKKYLHSGMQEFQ